MKKILLALLTSCALVSCEGYFDQLPKTELPSETFYTSYDAALRNVAILYANAGHVNDGIMTSDRFMMPSLMNEGPFDLTSTSGSVLNLWSKHYAYIAQANLILERLETNKEVIDENAGHSALDKATITGSATEMLMGEVRFLRAYAYFTLYRYYGGVPDRSRIMCREQPARRCSSSSMTRWPMHWTSVWITVRALLMVVLRKVP